jgi:multicomponent Na+:H+ antiporter subunit A
MLVVVLAGFGLGLTAPWLQRSLRGATGWLIALLPLVIAIYFARLLPAVTSGETLAIAYPWIAGLGIELSFAVDGLSLMFALLVSAIGALIVIYAGAYLADHPQLGRFYAFLLMFMAAMLGLVLADDIITLYIFWELTSISSYLLIGFNHRDENARSSALQALLVTSAGGLALLAGLLLLGEIGGSYTLSTLIERGTIIKSDPLYLPALLLILLGAFTKSAQWPFHFWLPGAMTAPTPASAYLHSATMVKAGVYLLLRLHPALGGTGAWIAIVTTAGAITMLLGALMAMAQTDLKRILAYSTVSALGTLVLLTGIGTTLAIEAALLFVLVHSCYKGALFMVAGAVDHGTGTRDITQLRGLGRAMPLLAGACVLAALSMAGVPPLGGFISKELLYETTLETGLTWALTAAAVSANVLVVGAAALVSLRPFGGDRLVAPHAPHAPSVGLWLGPLVLAVVGALGGLLPEATGGALVEPALGAVLGKPYPIELALWHGLNTPLLLSVVTLIGGVGAYALTPRFRAGATRLRSASAWGPARWYDLLVSGMLLVATIQTRVLQNGHLRRYLSFILMTTIGLTGWTLWDRVSWSWPADMLGIRPYEAIVPLLILLATLVVVRTNTRLAAVAALGVVGYGVSLIFLLYGGPDLAMTQIAIETLSVILFVLVLYRLPRFANLSTRRARQRDALIALAGGGLMTTLMLAALSTPLQSRLTPFFADASYPEANGRNIVNVILVDFRGLDTLGEITVLSVAAIGVYALLKLRPQKRKR